MRPTFHHRAVNGPFEDPVVYVRLQWQRRGLLLDLGDLRRLSQGELLKLTDVFITHTHIDHFIGFDTLLRALLRRPQPLRLYGPLQLLECLKGRLRGYSWNLIKDYPLELQAVGVGPSGQTEVGFRAREGFSPSAERAKAFQGPLLSEEHLQVRAALLRHDIDCLAYALEEPYHININKVALSQMGLPVGPWLSRLKQAIREGLPDETPFEVQGRVFSLAELRSRLIHISKGQKLAYVMDAAPTEENLGKIVQLAQGADTLYSEAYFLHRDLQRARERNHLTAALAGDVARAAGVGRLVIMHLSHKYHHQEEALLREAREAFGGPVSLGGA
jgi:ribonuclease Z